MSHFTTLTSPLPCLAKNDGDDAEYVRPAIHPRLFGTCEARAEKGSELPHHNAEASKGAWC